jgi:hypothetical protein
LLLSLLFTLFAFLVQLQYEILRISYLLCR